MTKALAIEINDRRAGWIQGADNMPGMAWESFDIHGESLGKSITRIDAVRKLAAHMGVEQRFGWRDYEKECTTPIKRSTLE